VVHSPPESLSGNQSEIATSITESTGEDQTIPHRRASESSWLDDESPASPTVQRLVTLLICTRIPSPRTTTTITGDILRKPLAVLLLF